MAITSSNVSSLGGSQPRGSSLSGAVSFVKGSNSKNSIVGANNIRPIRTKIGAQIENIKPKGNIGERSNVVRDFVSTFGNEKTEKILTKNLKILRDTYVETFEVARLLRASSAKLGSGLAAGGGGGGGGGLLGNLLGGGIGFLITRMIGSALAGVWRTLGNITNWIRGRDPRVTGGKDRLGRTNKQTNIKNQNQKTNIKQTPKGQNKITTSGGKDITTSKKTNIQNQKTNIKQTPKGEPKISTSGGKDITTSSVGDTVKKAKKPNFFQRGIDKVKKIKPKGNLLTKATQGLKNMGTPGKVAAGVLLGGAAIFGLTRGGKKEPGATGGIGKEFADQFNSIVDRFGGWSNKTLEAFAILGALLRLINPLKGKQLANLSDSTKETITSIMESESVNTIIDTQMIAAEPRKLLIPTAKNKKPKVVMLPMPGVTGNTASVGGQQKIKSSDGGSGTSPDIPFNSTSKSDSYASLETRMIYNIVG